MTEKIIAVVVTFNRKTYLLECLKALKAQTRPLDTVLIIDNASTDGTEETVRSSGLLDERFIFDRLASNTGGAGGFHSGMAKAMELGADWLWVMDDDVAPEANCLEELLRYRDMSQCIHPRKTMIDGDDFIWEHSIDILTGGRTFINNRSFENGKNIVFTNLACFEGMLVSRDVVEKAGLPDPKYFIGEDDTLFGVRASVHTNISFVSTAHMRKLISVGPSAPWKAFYESRNAFYLFRDACDYMGLQPTFTQRCFFVVGQCIGLLRRLKRGIAFFPPALKGFFAGLAYMRSAKAEV